MLGKPTKNIPIIHVAGTNGKGSVSVKLAECCQRSGLKTGLFTSPHIFSFRERYQINRSLISKETLLVSQNFSENFLISS